MTVKVLVPATITNLGAGFDCFGLAVSFYNLFTIEPWPKGFSLEINSCSREILHKASEDLIYDSLRRFGEETGRKIDGARMKIELCFPFYKGLGGEATFVLGSLMAANEITKAGLSKADLLELGLKVLGQPDNLSAGLIGGFVLSFFCDRQLRCVKLPFPEDLRILVAIPDIDIDYREARNVIPRLVPREDAVYNLSRSALFMYSLLTRNYSMLTPAMDDRLHQPYRRKLIPGMQEAFLAAKSSGALGISLCGTGSSVVVLARENLEEVGLKVRCAYERQNIRCEVYEIFPDCEGARVVESVGETAE